MTERKFLLFDADHSLESLGSRQRQTEILGVPPVTIKYGIDQVETYLLGREATGNKPAIPPLITKEQPMEEHPIFGQLPGEARWVFTETGREIGLTGIMIDTLSELCEQTKDELVRQKGKEEMNQHLWTLYIDKVRRFLALLAELDLPIIVTSHIRRDSDENGAPLDAPGLPGSSTRQNAPRYFTAVFYTRVDRNSQNGQVQHSWQTRPDTRRFFAKQRSEVGTPELLPTFIPQNLKMVLDAYADVGIDAPKVLILGDAGQGKTSSLATANQPYDEEMAVAA